MSATSDLQILANPTREELEAELAAFKAGVVQDPNLVRAREWLTKKIADDIDWWYERARMIALQGDSRKDQVRQVMVCSILNKILPDKREVSRGLPAGAAGGGTTVLIKNVNRGTTASVKEAKAARGDVVDGEVVGNGAARRAPD